jgi:Flp pilus assembly protein TadG
MFRRPTTPCLPRFAVSGRNSGIGGVMLSENERIGYSKRHPQEAAAGEFTDRSRPAVRGLLGPAPGVCHQEESQRGSMLVECALLMPVLLIFMIGMLDYSRVFLTAISVASAAQAGAEYGSSRSSAFTDYTGMQNAAARDAAQLSSFTATASQYCSCSPGGTSVSCSTTICSGYGSPAKYVKVQTTSTFHTLFPYPSVPSSATLNATAYIRVQ